MRIMGLFLYETHLHTKQASACGIISGAQHVRFYKEAGYSGIVVTDHFFNGNSCVPKNLPWEERIDLFCKGYEEAKEEGDKLGLSVFFGWEANFKATEFLIYGLDKEWLKSHPEILSWSVEEQYQQIHAAGGFIVHAHPFRKRAYIEEIRLFPSCVDAVEGINIGNRNDEFDRHAIAYAKKHKLPILAGSDAHGIENYRSGIAFKRKAEDMKDFLDMIKAGKYELIKPKKS
jgi:histidinol phosphatase-like PHP family hydrolase